MEQKQVYFFHFLQNLLSKNLDLIRFYNLNFTSESYGNLQFLFYKKYHNDCKFEDKLHL